MIRRSFAMFAALSLVTVAQAVPAVAQESRPSSYPDQMDRYTADQLDNLVGPIALYPDALLAQVLVAATFPDQVEDAARYVRANGTADIDDQSWDISVKAVAHYPSALNTMADKPDWTTTLGRAYALQSSEVMAAVQRMRAAADAQGNLRTTSQQVVTRDNDDYVIAPAQERIIYVPVYDPYVIYTRPIFNVGYYSPFWSFGVGFPIGGWLSYDCNWRSRAVYYNGWDRSYYGYAGGWRGRSAPFIHFSTVYVNPRRNVYINTDVINRRVDYRNVDRYQGYHRDTRFGGRDVDYRGGADRVRDVPDRGRYTTQDTRGGYVPGAPRGTDNRGSDNRSGDYRGGYVPNSGRANDARGNDSRGGYVPGADRGTDNRGNDNRGNDNRGNDNRGGYVPGADRGADNRGGAVPGTDRGNDTRGRDAQQGGTPPQNPGDANRGGWGRDVNRDGSWGRDGGNRQSASQDASRPSRPEAVPVPQRAPQDTRRYDGPMVNPRRVEESAPRAPQESRGGWQRNEGPMVNPRRAESPAPRAPSGGGPSRGGERGGRERGHV